jgi:hypothetical protein
MVMNINTYLGLALTFCLSIASTPLLAEVAPAAEQPVAREHLVPSELQRQQAEHNRAIITAPETKIREPLEPSELQRQQADHKEERIIESMDPSELQRQQAEHNKAIAK